MTSRWETVGVESQVVRSKDHDWPGRTQERNLILRIDRVGAAREVHHTLVDAVHKGAGRLVPGVTVGEDLAPHRASAARPATAAGPTPAGNGIPVSGGVPARPATTGGAAARSRLRDVLRRAGRPTTSSG
ncbi:hypothetical protein [Streptomyces sp. NPDC048269]|uniref:hypothetical protein n=1 Tax=Streptomyces sp. NPDC048269 TaxID=3155753 RepID=UPI00342B9700